MNRPGSYRPPTVGFTVPAGATGRCTRRDCSLTLRPPPCCHCPSSLVSYFACVPLATLQPNVLLRLLSADDNGIRELRVAIKRRDLPLPPPYPPSLRVWCVAVSPASLDQAASVAVGFGTIGDWRCSGAGSTSHPAENVVMHSENGFFESVKNFRADQQNRRRGKDIFLAERRLRA